MNELQLELKELVDKINSNSNHPDRWIDRTNSYTDFCREIILPGENEKLPNGAVGLRVDDDFWAIAIVLYRFKELSCKELVDVIFPDAKDPKYRADSGSREQIIENITIFTKVREEMKEGLEKDGYTGENLKETLWYYDTILKDLNRSLTEYNNNKEKTS